MLEEFLVEICLLLQATLRFSILEYAGNPVEHAGTFIHNKANITHALTNHFIQD
jgi:hypothetical protein